MKPYIILLFTSLFFVSCFPSRYVHAPLVVSNLEKKGDYSISGAFATSSETKNFNINGNYAISNHILVQSSFTYKDDYLKEGNRFRTKGSAFDLALGYTNNTKDKMFFLESFLGYGAGKIDNTAVLEKDSYVNFTYDKIFSQVNFNLKFDSSSSTSNYISLHFPIRLEYLHYNQIKSNNFNQNFGNNSLEYLNENRDLWVFSIGKTLSYHLDKVTLSLFASYHSPADAISALTLNNAYIGLGVNWKNFLSK